MCICGVLFDLDGTLADTLTGILASSRAALGAVLPGRAVPELAGLVGPPIREVFRQALPDLDSQTLELLVRAFREHYDRAGWRESRVYPRARETLQQLCAWGLRCFVVTNKPHAVTDKIVRHLRLSPLLAAALCPDSRRPGFASKEAIVRYCLATFALDPGRTVLVGDSLEDAAAAHACGLSFAAALYGYGAAGAQPGYPVHYRLRALPELLRVVGRGNARRRKV